MRVYDCVDAFWVGWACFKLQLSMPEGLPAGEERYDRQLHMRRRPFAGRRPRANDERWARGRSRRGGSPDRVGALRPRLALPCATAMRRPAALAVRRRRRPRPAALRPPWRGSGA